MKPLTGQAVAVQRKHTIQERVPLLNPQHPALAINQGQLIVQTRMRRRRPDNCQSHHASHREY
ncbi:Uncharacterised protein [Mycobacteroides abscessus subsp. bolletii]|nr:Uncharacterised protein [Mycobacteroides abscessus subsp. bolletii]